MAAKLAPMLANRSGRAGHAGFQMTPLSCYVLTYNSERLLAKRYDAKPGTVYLIRPDQHVAARWRSFNPAEAKAALARALAKG